MHHRNPFHPAGINEEFEDVASNDERGEKRRQNSERKGDSKPFDRAARFPEQNDRGDQCSYVGVKDRTECLFVSGLDRDLERFAKGEFFTQALVNQNTGIDREADCQNNSGNARQRQNKAEHGQRAEEQHDVHQQRQARDDAGKAIVNRNAYQRNGQTDKTGHDAGANRICPKRRGYAAFFFDAHWRLQGILQNTGETTRFFFGEMTGNHRVAPINGIANHRGRLDNAIQDNGEPMTFVLLGNLPEFLRALAIELQLHRPAFIAVIGIRSAHAIASKVGFLFHKQTLDRRLLVIFGSVFVILDFVFRRYYLDSFVDRSQPFAVIRINQTEFELGYF